MTPSARWQSARAVCERIWDAPEAERAQILSGLGDTDRELVADVEALLEADSAAGSFLERPPVVMAEGEEGAPDDSMSAVEIGARIGRYSVERLIARGGMGDVFEAIQALPLRRVALKVLRAELGTRSGLRRFALEAEALGRLRHPSIAQVYEADVWTVGQDGAERAYLAMELVEESRSITEFARERELSVHERVDLFLQLCEAIEHAHQRGIIHRDLKPSNILTQIFDGRPRVKVIDFGIAKLLESDSAELMTRTEPGRLVGTVAYMSPEQIGGDSDQIDTRSDVYALGVVLYELLAGRLPYDVSEQSMFAIMAAIRNAEPVALGRAAPDVARDLEIITMHALRKNPDERYQSVGALSADLERWRDGRPIEARAASAWYQLGCFAKRHKVAASAVIGVALALGVGIAGTSWQASRAARSEARANERLADLRNLTNSLIFELHDPLAVTTGTTHIRELLIRRGLEYLDRIGEDADQADDELLRMLASGYHRLGMVQGHPLTPNIGDMTGARISLTKSIGYWSRMSRTVENRRALAKAHYLRGLLIGYSGHVVEAETDLAVAVDMCAEICREHPEDLEARLEFYDWSRQSVKLFDDTRQSEPAQRMGDALIKFHRAAPDVLVTNDDHFRARGAIHFAVADVSARLGRISEALESYERSAESYEAYLRSSPNEFKRWLGRGNVPRYKGIALSKAGRMQEAADEYAIAATYYRQAIELDPSHYPSNHVLGLVLGEQAIARMKCGDCVSAFEVANESVAVMESLSLRDPNSQRSVGDLIAALEIQARVLADCSRQTHLSDSERSAYSERALEALQRALGLIGESELPAWVPSREYLEERVRALTEAE